MTYRGVETSTTRSDPDRAARFTALYVRDHPRVCAYVHRRTGDRAAAEELTAEVFRTAWERMTAGHDVGTGWLFVAARNLLSNHYRSMARLTEMHRTLADALGRATAPGRDDAVLDALDRLPSAHREVLLLSYWDGLSAAEAGEVLGCGASAVWVRLHRAQSVPRRLRPASGARVMRVKSLIKNADPIPDTAYEGLSARAADELAALVGPGGAAPPAVARRPSRRGFLVAAVATTVAVGIGGVALVSRESDQPGQTGGPAGPRVADEPFYGSTATLERAADVIVRARLGAGREETVDDIPTTVATATVLAAAKGGTSGDTLRVSYPTPGSGPETAPLSAGREYVLLLEKGEDGRYFLVNTTQGWYAVQDGAPVAGKDNGVALSPGVRKALRLTP